MSDETTIVAVFEDQRVASAVVARLKAEGAPEDAVFVIGAEDEAAAQRLADAGVTPGKAALYQDALRRGFVLLVVRVPVDAAPELSRVLGEAGALPEQRPAVPARDVRFEAFREALLELPEFTEEVVAVKRPWVVEEVVVRKVVRERTEVVRETLRRQDVTVEDVAG